MGLVHLVGMMTLAATVLADKTTLNDIEIQYVSAFCRSLFKESAILKAWTDHLHGGLRTPAFTVVGTDTASKAASPLL